MYYQIKLTDALREKAMARQRHFAQLRYEWQSQGAIEGRGWFGKWKRPAPPFPEQDKWDFYTGVVNIPPEVKHIFVTPEEYRELTQLVYGFDIVANAISATHILATNTPIMAGKIKA